MVDEQLAAARLGRALAFRTVSHADPARVEWDEFCRLHAYFAATFPRVHAELAREVVGEYSLLYRWDGSDQTLEPILLMSHLDVVPVETGTEADWTYAPFSGAVADGYIWGRGALDVKCGLVGLLEASELLLAAGFRPQRTVYLAVGHDEEVGGAHGNARMAALLAARGVRLQFVLDEGGAIGEGLIHGVTRPVAFVAIAEKRSVNVELAVEQEGGHASSPPAETAIGILAAAITRLQSHPFPARLHPATESMLERLGPALPFPVGSLVANRRVFARLLCRQFAKTPAGNAAVRTTTAVTLFEAGVRENVLPRRARAVLNCRLLPDDTVEKLLDQVRGTVNDARVRAALLPGAEDSQPSPVADSGSASFALLEQTIRQIFPDVLVAPCLAVHTTDSRHYARIAENIYRFIPARLTAADLERIHGVDERIAIGNYADIIRFFAALIQSSCGPG
jgi:carboxypeptidase PM20D1